MSTFKGSVTDETGASFDLSLSLTPGVSQPGPGPVGPSTASGTLVDSMGNRFDVSITPEVAAIVVVPPLA
jgi:hypothetical protein